LVKYSVEGITERKDAQGEAFVQIQVNGEKRLYSGRGLSTDVNEASLLAYIDAYNRYFAINSKRG
jgi:2-isopropylmalate synthase